MFKVKNELSPGIICDIFIQRINNHYNLRNINFYLKHKKYLFETPFVRTIYKRTESVSCLGPKILGHCSRRLNSLNSFKESKKKKKKKKEKKKNGYHLTIPVDFVKPMYMVLVL